MDEAWSRFEVSGKITDYLKCKNMDAEVTQSAATGSNVTISGGKAMVGGKSVADNRSNADGKTVTSDLQKERPDGTEYRGDRNGLTCNADWRV